MYVRDGGVMGRKVGGGGGEGMYVWDGGVMGGKVGGGGGEEWWWVAPWQLLYQNENPPREWWEKQFTDAKAGRYRSTMLKLC